MSGFRIMSNLYCDILGISVPSVEAVKSHRRANTYSLMLVALLERGGSMTLVEVAQRLDEVGYASADAALRSLKRCHPARAPIYRDGDLYALDPRDDELDRWVFRLDLRPPQVPILKVVRPDPPPLPGPDVPLSVKELEEAFQGADLGTNWSAQRLALAVLDAHGGAMTGTDVRAALDRLATRHGLRAGSADHWGRGSAVTASDDGTWRADLAHPTLRSAREAVRKRIEDLRRQQSQRPDPSVVTANIKRYEARRAAHVVELARLRRTIIHAFPERDPEAVVLVDVNERALTTYMRDGFDTMRGQLDGYDVIGGINVRAVLRAIDHDPGARRLVELGSLQKSRRLNKAGRTLRITLALLVQGSCGISRPFADPRRLREYLDQGQLTKFQRRLEADAKSLFALYQYGRLHGTVRLRWGFLDEKIAAPWKHTDEPSLYSVMRDAHEQGREVEVVVGSAPGWADPWSRVRRCTVEEFRGYGYTMFDDWGVAIDEREVQIARLGAHR